nr:hypothetical protein HmN_000138100 [Hymenolepis microstoma]
MPPPSNVRLKLPSWLAAENAKPDGELPVKEFHQRYYLTLIVRNYTNVPTAISCLYVEHDDHMHVAFQASSNVYRKVERLLNDCHVPLRTGSSAKVLSNTFRTHIDCYDISKIDALFEK